MDLKPEQNTLKQNFQRAAEYFNLSPEAREIAWLSARADFENASACYQAIVNSLPRPKVQHTVVPAYPMVALRSFTSRTGARVTSL